MQRATFNSVLNMMRVAAVFALALAGCAQQAATDSTVTDVTSASEEELHRYVGQRVSAHGEFSLFGKFGPFIIIGDRPIYLVPLGAFRWGERYSAMEKREVRFTGVLQFAKHPEAKPGMSAVAAPPDYFYFDAETVLVELQQK